MAEKNNATCSICGNEYYVCNSCRDSMKLTPWKTFTDTAEHYKIHQIIRGFSTGVYSKDEAKEKLQNVDLSDLDTFKKNIKSIIKDILKEDKNETKVNESTVDSMTEVENKAERVAPVRNRKYSKAE